MATQATGPGGTAQIQYRVALPDQQYIDFSPDQVVFVESTIHDGIDGTCKCNHMFRSSNPVFVNKLKQAMSDAKPILLYRIGYGIPGGITWLPWQSHMIVEHKVKFIGIGQSAGHLIAIRSSNNLARMRHTNRVITRKGLISSIVEEIAAANDLKCVVEPTDGKFMLVQSFIDDTAFLFERLLPRAINKKGHAGYFCYIRDNVLHFHTLDYQADVQTLDYYNTTSVSLESTDSSQVAALWDEGLAGMVVVTSDPYTGASAEVKSRPDNAVKLADSIYNYENVKNGAWNMPYHLGSNPRIEAQALAQSAYQKSRLKTFDSQVITNQNIVIRHGDLLNLLLNQTNTQTSDYNGYYLVASASHLIKKGSVKSSYGLVRGETAKLNGSLSAQNAQKQLIPETRAPGVFPNIVELQSSQLTKGAGKEASARTYSVVADAQTGGRG